MPESTAARVSVIIPAYNAEQSIARTLGSVSAQTFPWFEAIVVDDGSSDGTVELVEKAARADARIRLIRAGHRGVAEARNRAASASEGEWLAPLDADDVWHPEFLEQTMRRTADADESTAVIYAWSTDIDEHDAPLPHVSISTIEGSVYATLLCHNFLGNASCTLVRRSAFYAIGGYEPKMSPVEDWDLYLRLAERYGFLAVEKFLVHYRQGEQNLSSNRERVAGAHSRMLESATGRNGWIPQWMCGLSRSNLYIYFARRSRERSDTGGMRRWLRAAAGAWALTPLLRPDWWVLMLFGGWGGGRIRTKGPDESSLLIWRLRVATRALHRVLQRIAPE